MEKKVVLKVLIFYVLFFSSCTNDKIDESLIDPIRLTEEIEITEINEKLELHTLSVISNWMTRPQDRADTQMYFDNIHLDTKGNWQIVWYANQTKTENKVGGILSKHRINKNTFNFSPSTKTLSEFKSYGNFLGVNVASGAEKCASEILNLKARNYTTNELVDFVSYLESYVEKDPVKNLPIKIYVSGESESGGISLLISTYIYEALQEKLSDVKLLPNDIRVKCFTFNAPSYISSDFASYFNSLPKKADNQDAFATIDYQGIHSKKDPISFLFPQNVFEGINAIDYPMSEELKEELNSIYYEIFQKCEENGVSYVSISENIEGKHDFIELNLQNKLSFDVPEVLNSLKDFKAYAYWQHNFRNTTLNNQGTCIPINPQVFENCPEEEDIIIPIKNLFVESYYNVLISE
ncbi:hypothetical protein [Aureivirga sp. CE67]|uniref:hypothetical protein n=1 Tax=Aureivirga sp. CE67 TaxID=1788983 RepID=UPI0018C9DB55|nr:hypothetical protein [Aureivirga sp. CE67]